MQNRLKIAMYLRLSKEDDRNTQESNWFRGKSSAKRLENCR